MALRSNNEDLGVCFCSVLTRIQKPTYHALSAQKPWPEPPASAFQDLRLGQSHVQAVTLARPGPAQSGLASAGPRLWAGPGTSLHVLNETPSCEAAQYALHVTLTHQELDQKVLGVAWAQVPVGMSHNKYWPMSRTPGACGCGLW